MDIKYPAGATPLDPDETGGLLLSHITTREELNHWEQLNIGEAEEWAFSRRHKEPFTWGRTDLVGPGKSRSAYIIALQAADEQNFSLLLKFARS
jgi:hypothetical protein